MTEEPYPTIPPFQDFPGGAYRSKKTEEEKKRKPRIMVMPDGGGLVLATRCWRREVAHPNAHVWDVSPSGQPLENPVSNPTSIIPSSRL